MQFPYTEINDIKHLTALREFVELEIKVIDKYFKVLLKENKTYALYVTKYMVQLQIELEHVNNQIKTMKKKTNNSVLSPDSSFL